MRFPTSAVFAVCLVLLASTGCREPQQASAKAEPAPKYVEIETVEPELLRHIVALTGTLNAEASVMIQPEIDGVIASIEFDEGAPVEKGAVLFRLRSDEQKAQLQLVQAELALARDVHDRTQRLNLQDISAVAKMAEAKAKLSEAEARVALARVALERTVMRAPFDGVVGMKRVDVGDRVDEDEVLVPFDAIDRLQLVFSVQSIGFNIGKVGDTIQARVFTYPGESFPGRIFFVSPTVDPATRRMLLKAWVPNPDHRLKPGMFANVDVEIARREGALVVPESTLVYDRSGTYVWKVDEKRTAQKVPVRIGLRQNGRVEVVEGLAPGDDIISVGTHKVKAGDAVVDARVGADTHAGAATGEVGKRSDEDGGAES